MNTALKKNQSLHTLNIISFKRDLSDLHCKLRTHELYNQLKSINDIKIFMENHVFAVWDFMSLVKALQIQLTTIEVPWIPNKNPINARFINEIVLGEESDLDIDDTPKSHFEMYLDAMNQVNAKTEKIDLLLNNIQSGNSVLSSINNVKLDRNIQDFIELTFKIIQTGKIHLIASAFTFGREDIIPEMFIEILDKVDPKNSQCNKLKYYLDRHIEIDGDLHGPLSQKMVEELCGNSSKKWNEAFIIAKNCLEKRIMLWDIISEKIKNEKLKKNRHLAAETIS